MSFFPKTLAIDFGTKRIGLAISRGSLAEPLKVLENSAQAISTLADLVVSEGIEQVVIGLSENKMAELTQEFGARLSQQIKVPIGYVDETLSSVTVTEKLLASGKTKLRRGTIDQYAAAEFLQDYLDSLVK